MVLWIWGFKTPSSQAVGINRIDALSFVRKCIEDAVFSVLGLGGGVLSKVYA